MNISHAQDQNDLAKKYEYEDILNCASATAALLRMSQDDYKFEAELRGGTLVSFWPAWTIKLSSFLHIGMAQCSIVGQINYIVIINFTYAVSYL